MGWKTTAEKIRHRHTDVGRLVQAYSHHHGNKCSHLMSRLRAATESVNGDLDRLMTLSHRGVQAAQFVDGTPCLQDKFSPLTQAAHHSATGAVQIGLTRIG